MRGIVTYLSEMLRYYVQLRAAAFSCTAPYSQAQVHHHFALSSALFCFEVHSTRLGSLARSQGAAGSYILLPRPVTGHFFKSKIDPIIKQIPALYYPFAFAHAPGRIRDPPKVHPRPPEGASAHRTRCLWARIRGLCLYSTQHPNNP